jgi:hypothetical protein
MSIWQHARPLVPACAGWKCSTTTTEAESNAGEWDDRVGVKGCLYT